MRDSLVFYRSFYEAIQNLPPDCFKEATLAIIEYGLDGTEPEFETEYGRIIFALVRPQIDANNKRYSNGKKGGRPKKKTEDEPEEKPEKKKKLKYGNLQKVKLTEEELLKLKTEYGEALTEECVQFLDEYIAEKGYKSQSHYLAIRRWVVEAVKEKKAKGKKKSSFNNFEQRNESYDDLIMERFKQTMEEN